PDPETSFALFSGLAAAGADLVEIGMPFSDPMADGPSVQAAGQRALKTGTTLRSTLAMVRRLRETDPDTPYVVMGYYNPIYRYGAEAFARDAVAAGVDGAIIVDLPPEEDEELAAPARAAGLDIVRLPTQRRAAPAGDRHPGQRLSLLCRDRRDYRHPLGRGSGCARRGSAAAPVHRTADRGRVRHQDPVASRRGRQGGRCRGGRLSR